MRHINKSCYIETTNENYIINRQTINEHELIINHSIMHEIDYNAHTNSLNITKPNAIIIELELQSETQDEYKPWFNIVKNVQCFQSLFTNIQYLSVQDFSNYIWAEIPIIKIFTPQISQKSIDLEFNFGGYRRTPDTQNLIQSIQHFQTQYEQCRVINNDAIRAIDTLKISNSKNKHNPVLSLCTTLKSNFARLVLEECEIQIKSCQQLQNLFHSDLTELILHSNCALDIGHKDYKNCVECLALKTLYLSHCDNNYGRHSRLMTKLSTFGVLNHVTKLDIDLQLGMELKSKPTIPFIGTLTYEMLVTLLDSAKSAICCPKLEFVNLNATIGDPNQLITLLDEIMALQMLQEWHHTIKYVTWNIYWTIAKPEWESDVFENANIRQDITDTFGWSFPIRTNDISPTIATTESIHVKLADIEKAAQWIYVCDQLFQGRHTTTKQIVIVCQDKKQCT